MSGTPMVKQISVFLENRPGTLCEMLECIGNNGINIDALSIADTTDFGIVRMVVADESLDQAQAVLRDAGFVAKVSQVVGAQVANEPGGLAKILGALKDMDVQVEYAYSMNKAGEAEAIILMQTSDNEAAAKALCAAGVGLAE